MARIGFAATVIIAVFVLAILGAALMVRGAFHEEIGTCSADAQYDVAGRFKFDALVFGAIGAALAAALYTAMLRFQIFSPAPGSGGGLPRAPHRDLRRMAFSLVPGVVLALILTRANAVWGSDCLQRAFEPASPVADLVAGLYSVAGLLAGNVWIAILLDHVLMALVALLTVRVFRETALRAGRGA